jgi:hypothetical protein
LTALRVELESEQFDPRSLVLMFHHSASNRA